MEKNGRKNPHVGKLRNEDKDEDEGRGRGRFKESGYMRRFVLPELNFFYNMPIVNGQFQTSSLGTPQDAQNAVFGDYTRRDMNGYSAAAYNYLMHQQDQAFALDMWKLMNQYNSPAAQMQRYKDAGLNSNLIYSQQQAGAGFNAPSTPSFSPSNTANNRMNTALNVIGQIRQIAEAAAGVSSTISQNSLRSHQQMAVDQQGSLNSLRGEQMRYLLGLSGTEKDSSLYTSPYARMYRSQIDAQQAKYEQMKAAISLIPDQKERQKALTELDKYRLAIMHGQNDAVLSINTGNPGLDSFFKLISYFLLNQSYW